MPGMNGIEMIRQGQASYPDTAYVVLSGYGDYEYTSQAMELGVRHYILKPCDDAKIIPVLGRAAQELEALADASRCSVTCCWAAHSRGPAAAPWWRNWVAASGR